MALNEKGASGWEPASAPRSKQDSLNHTPPTAKWKRVLTAFVEGRSLNRFEAERPVAAGGLSDHCLHSTVSEIQGKGVRIERRMEKVHGYQNVPTDCCRYWLAEEDKQKALDLLAGNAAPKPDKAAQERWESAVRAEEQARRERARRPA